MVTSAGVKAMPPALHGCRNALKTGTQSKTAELTSGCALRFPVCVVAPDSLACCEYAEDALRLLRRFCQMHIPATRGWYITAQVQPNIEYRTEVYLKIDRWVPS